MSSLLDEKPPQDRASSASQARTGARRSLSREITLTLAIGSAVFTMIGAALLIGWYSTAQERFVVTVDGPDTPSEELDPLFVSSVFLALLGAFILLGVVMALAQIKGNRADLRYDEARTRVQAAESALQSALESQDEKLALQRIWSVVHERLEQYHQDAQRQGRIAFSRAMGAMSLGFFVLTLCVVAATFFTTSPGGIIVIGALGAVSAGVAGYVSKTYLRAYQDSATHLRAYFAQPVEASRFLFAERAVAVSGLPDSDRAELMKVLVQAMVTGQFGTTKAAETP
jgi:glycerol uptake facilitator-like aquaporin